MRTSHLKFVLCLNITIRIICKHFTLNSAVNRVSPSTNHLVLPRNFFHHSFLGLLSLVSVGKLRKFGRNAELEEKKQLEGKSL